MGEKTHNGRQEPEGLTPRDAWLLSYLDNELVPEQRAQFEAWLARDPAAREAVEEHYRVTELFAEAEIEEPAWDETLAGIHYALRQKPVPTSRPRPGAGWPLR
jgi:anti-sigma factor RsiW